MGLAVYVATLLPVVLGVVAGLEVLTPGREIPYGQDRLLLRFAAWDGGQFMEIMDNGYQYQPKQISNIVVFPGYPVLGQLVRKSTGLSAAASLLVVSHICLLVTLIIYHRLMRLRFGRDETADVSLMVLAVLPTTFFWRMAYSESPFVMMEVLFLYGMQRKWSCERLAVVVGVATSFRLVGLAMLLPVAMEFADRSLTKTSRLTLRRLWQGCLVVAISLSGICAFMMFQWIRFGDAMLFAKGQESYFLRPPVNALDHWYRLVTLEPVWATYLPESDCYWYRHARTPGMLLNLQFWNPIWFSLTCGLVFWGWFRRILTDTESALGAALLLIPYIGRAEEFCMGCQARYATAAIPAIIVLGQLLSGTPAIVRAGVVIAGVSLLTLYSAMFGAWYFFL